MTSLQGKTFITTGSAETSISLATQLAETGAQVFTLPMICISPIPINEEIFKTLQNLESYDWLMFTSKYGVKMFFKALLEVTNSYKLPNEMQIACVGKQTAETLEHYEYSAIYVSSKNNGKDFAQELTDLLPSATRILFPTGNLTHDMIALTVPQFIQIQKLLVYKTEAPETFNSKICEKIIQNQYDRIIFTSPSGVTNFVEIFRRTIDIRDLRVVSIGPTTTERLNSFAIKDIIQAKEYNAQGIIDAIVD
jgi:uroporphyrinogen-III synthase